jgi:hypothetical protein
MAGRHEWNDLIEAVALAGGHTPEESRDKRYSSLDEEIKALKECISICNIFLSFQYYRRNFQSLLYSLHNLI